MNVTKVLSGHPGGEIAIPSAAGRDATEKCNKTHLPDGFAQGTVIGKVGSSALATGSFGDEEPEAEEPAPVIDTVPRQRWADLAAGVSDEDEEAAPAAAAEEVDALKDLMEKAEAQLDTTKEAETTRLHNYEMLA